MNTTEIIALIGGVIAVLTPFVGFLVGQYIRILQYKHGLKDANEQLDDPVKLAGIKETLKRTVGIKK